VLIIVISPKSYNALLGSIKSACLYFTSILAILLSLGCFASNERNPVEGEDAGSDNPDSEIVEEDAAIGVTARDSGRVRDASKKDASLTYKSQDSPNSRPFRRDGDTSSTHDADLSDADAETIDIEKDSSARDADDAELVDANNRSVSETDAGSAIDDKVCSDYGMILARESCDTCVGSTSCFAEASALNMSPCTASERCIQQFCTICDSPVGCEPDTCDCVASCLPVERGECHERWERLAGCVIAQCEGC